jgi:WD40 repeat protein
MGHQWYLRRFCRLIWVASFEKVLLLWDLEKKVAISQIEVSSMIRDIQLDGKGMIVALAANNTHDITIFISTADGLKKYRELVGHTTFISKIRLMNDGGTLLYASCDITLTRNAHFVRARL